MACRKRYVVELGKPRWAPAVRTAMEWNTGIEAMKGKPGIGTRLEPALLWENHESGGRHAASLCPRGVLSDIVLRDGESPSQGEGSDGSV